MSCGVLAVLEHEGADALRRPLSDIIAARTSPQFAAVSDLPENRFDCVPMPGLSMFTGWSVSKKYWPS